MNASLDALWAYVFITAEKILRNVLLPLLPVP